MSRIDVEHFVGAQEAVEAARQAMRLRISRAAYEQVHRSAVDQALDRATINRSRKTWENPDAPVDREEQPRVD
jgi:hypothetical protein